MTFLTKPDPLPASLPLGIGPHTPTFGASLPILSPLLRIPNPSPNLVNFAFQIALESFHFFPSPPKPPSSQLLWPLCPGPLQAPPALPYPLSNSFFPVSPQLPFNWLYNTKSLVLSPTFHSFPLLIGRNQNFLMQLQKPMWSGPSAPHSLDYSQSCALHSVVISASRLQAQRTQGSYGFTVPTASAHCKTQRTCLMNSC